jgi:RNA polymerase sigma-70 factor (ECF subfamily)
MAKIPQPMQPGGVLMLECRACLGNQGESVVNEASESDLIAQAKKDAQAFGALYERYVSKVYNYIYYRVGNHHDAEDLTERTFLRALKHMPNYEDRGAPISAWFYRIAHNLVANWHRDQGRHPVVALDSVYLEDTPDLPETVIIVSEEHEELFEAIRQLPADRQQLLVLKFVERLSNAEIGAIMERTEGAIKSLYHRTLTALRQELVTFKKEK